MGLYISPLVDVKENDVAATIQSVSTSISAHVIRCPKKGPELKKMLISSEDMLISTFGTPSNLVHNYEDILSACGALINSSNLYCVGVRPDDATFAGITSTNTEGLSGMGSIALSATDSYDLQFTQLEQERR